MKYLFICFVMILSLFPPYFSLEYNVRVLPFEDQPNHGMVFIYKWYNLQYFQDGKGTYLDANILYLDSDTVFYGDVQYLFDHYDYREVRRSTGRSMGKHHQNLLNNLEELRKSAGLTQQELSESAEVSRKSINAIENGVYVPSTVLALKIAKTLGCKVEDLFKLPKI